MNLLMTAETPDHVGRFEVAGETHACDLDQVDAWYIEYVNNAKRRAIRSPQPRWRILPKRTQIAHEALLTYTYRIQLARARVQVREN